MLDFILARMKAWVAAMAVAIVPAVIKSTETSLGFDIPTEIEVTITMFITGLFVHQVPNKQV